MGNTITMTIRGKVPVLSGVPYLVCDNADYTLVLDTDSEWDAYDTKIVLFVLPGRSEVYPILTEENRCRVPVIARSGFLKIGVTAGEELRTSRDAEIRVRPSIRTAAGEGSTALPPTLAEQIVERLDELEQSGGGGSADAVLYTPQELTQEEQETARGNIGAQIADFVVNFGQNDPYTADKTFAEVLAAYEAGATIIGRQFGKQYDMYSYSTGEGFGFITDNTAEGYYDMLWLWYDESVSFYRNDKPYPVTSVNGKTGAVVLTAEDILTEADKTEIAEEAAGIVDESLAEVIGEPDAAVPAVPGYMALGMTGAAVGQVARVAAVDADGKPTSWEPVDLPSGGSEPTEAERIVYYTADAAAAEALSIAFTVDEYPKLAEYNHLYGILKWTTYGTMPWVELQLNNTAVSKRTTGAGGMLGFDITKHGNYYNSFITALANPSAYNDWTAAAAYKYGVGKFRPTKIDTLSSVALVSWTKFIDEGGTIEIWGWND